MDDERGPSGLKNTIRDPFQYTRDKPNLSPDQFKTAAPKKTYDDFPPLSDEEYGEMEDHYNARQQSGDALAKKVSGMKREAHKPPPKPKAPPTRVQVAQRRSSLISKMARNAKGRKRW